MPKNQVKTDIEKPAEQPVHPEKRMALLELRAEVEPKIKAGATNEQVKDEYASRKRISGHRFN